MILPKLAAGDGPADVTLLLEGTWPYVRGGVSSWVQQMIAGLPRLRFAVVFLGSRREDYEKVQYTLPPNVVHVEDHYLMGGWHETVVREKAGNRPAFALNDKLHQAFKADGWQAAAADLRRVAALLGEEKGLTREDFLYSRAAWDQIGDYYERYCTDPSFVNYFWTVRTMHAPLFDLADIAQHMPRTRVLHAISTGYAGFLGALVHERRRIPLILTEHGIYTKERRIDLAQAEWITDVDDPAGSAFGQDISYMRQRWIRFFEGLGHMTYQSAAAITALYSGNSAQQQRDGAPPERCCVIPNGIDVDRYQKAFEARPEHIPLVLGLIGRVVSIKDIKTFIRAMRAVVDQKPAAEGWIVGPTEEDPGYAQECESLIDNLGLKPNVKLLGFRRIDEILPQLGLVVLTSISEAQPLVVLEAFAAGLPVVTTDVGSCRDLVYGVDDEDRELGVAGEVVPIASPLPFADAALRLLGSPEAWKKAQCAGHARVERYYRQAMMFDRYRALYEPYLLQSNGAPATPGVAAAGVH
ncbi:MAG TPA: GT4 family glycosyltransferase PelF [Nevskiaceae bacterium]|nr:GT4 family glycosyltransferase PelF [Nevskiaceae bacterium]